MAVFPGELPAGEVVGLPNPTMPVSTTITDPTVSRAQFPVSTSTSAPQMTWQDVAQNFANIGIQQLNAKQRQQYELALAKINAGHGNMPVFTPASSWKDYIAPVLIGAAALGLLFYIVKKGK